MFAADWEAACPGCTASVDTMPEKLLAQVGSRDTTLALVSIALLDLTAFGRSEDWEEPAGRARVMHGADPAFTD